MYTDCHYDEAKALYLLKLHHYHIPDTLHTLTLQKPDRSNPNFQWLYTKRSASATSTLTSTNELTNELVINTASSSMDRPAANLIVPNGSGLAVPAVATTEIVAEEEESDLSSDDEDHLYRYHGGMSIMGNVMSPSHGHAHWGDGGRRAGGDGVDGGGRGQGVGDGAGSEPMYDDEDYCFSCGDGGSLLICDEKDCLKVWHIHCAGLTRMPLEEQWFCPSHSCCVCRAQSVETASSRHFQCSYCATAYCDQHCPAECTLYRFANIEFLCETCLSTNDGDDALKFAAERFESRLMELHKRKRIHLLRTQV